MALHSRSCVSKIYMNVYIGIIMALSIKDEETDRLARELARATGLSLTEAIREALRDALARERHPRRNLDVAVRRIQERLAKLPVVDPRSPDEILGYDEHGLPR